MQQLPEQGVSSNVSVGRQAVRYILHLAFIYLLTTISTPYMAGWTHARLLPFLGHATNSTPPEFLFSHLFAFSFIPAFATGFVNARFRHSIAQYVWVVPLALLAYKVITFPSNASVLGGDNGLLAGLHYYFGGGFSVPEFHSFRYVFDNADAVRGFAQTRVTAPVYAGVAYSLAAFICMRWKRTLQQFIDSVERWA